MLNRCEPIGDNNGASKRMKKLEDAIDSGVDDEVQEVVYGTAVNYGI